MLPPEAAGDCVASFVASEQLRLVPLVEPTALEGQFHSLKAAGAPARYSREVRGKGKKYNKNSVTGSGVRVSREFLLAASRAVLGAVVW